MQYKNNFFDFNFVQTSGEEFTISNDSRVFSDNECYAKKYAEKVISETAGDVTVSIFLRKYIPENIINKIKDYRENEEAYILEINTDTVNVYSMSNRGLIYGVSTLKQLVESGSIAPLILFDCPDKPIRGYRVYTPGRENIDTFKNMIDTMVYYKYNSIMIEVGGAMEYEKHPEINETWVKFCAEVHKSPYEAERIQKKTYPNWAKNSIHADNGCGGFITKSQMRDIVEYCREREITVIPEVPSLSHSDYIVMAHPDLNERVEDAYPDTYCPSNPKSYEIVFDILDEVIEVFEPEYINIGHDECYTLAICDKCNGKSPVDLYAGDIIKINNYLTARGIKVIMWGEKLYNAYLKDEDGKIWPVGGTGHEKQPELYPCRYKIPTNILQLQWYWSLCSYEQEKEIADLGFSSIYGNFRAPSLMEYRKRMSQVSGGFVSNWGSCEEEYMQRNGQNYSLITTAYTFWNDKYDDDMRLKLQDKAENELYRRYLKSLGEHTIEIIHTTDHFRPYKVFYDGYYIVPEDHIIGWHIVTYEDNTVAELPVIYGYNIRYFKNNTAACIVSEEAIPSAEIEVLGATIPMKYGDKVYYKTAYKNPYPQKTIKTIEYKAKDGIEVFTL